MVDVLLRAAPFYVRAERERKQADEVYKAGTSLNVRHLSTCIAQHFFHSWSRFLFPEKPLRKPTVKVENLLDLVPIAFLEIPLDGDVLNRSLILLLIHSTHGIWMMEHPQVMSTVETGKRSLCNVSLPGTDNLNSENLLATRAPSTTKCDLCQVSFCGIGVPGRCSAYLINSQQPEGMLDLAGLIQSLEVYECFDGNTVEVDILLDYLIRRQISPKHIYREVRPSIIYLTCTNGRPRLWPTSCRSQWDSFLSLILNSLLIYTMWQWRLIQILVLLETEYADYVLRRFYFGECENGGYVKGRKACWTRPS
jgi:E3 ubiquitin-protein ligase CHFR